MTLKLISSINSITTYTDLSPTKTYEVIGISADDFRIINDQGRPYIYPADIFTVLDETIPSDWVVKYGEGGEKYACPIEFHEPGFFEDYFDGKPEAINIFSKYVINL